MPLEERTRWVISQLCAATLAPTKALRTGVVALSGYPEHDGAWLVLAPDGPDAHRCVTLRSVGQVVSKLALVVKDRVLGGALDGAVPYR